MVPPSGNLGTDGTFPNFRLPAFATQRISHSIPLHLGNSTATIIRRNTCHATRSVPFRSGPFGGNPGIRELWCLRGIGIGLVTEHLPRGILWLIKTETCTAR